MSSLVHGVMTRRAVFLGAVDFFAAIFFVATFLTISVLMLKARHLYIEIGGIKLLLVVRFGALRYF